ncbi:MAG TPA: guanylate kinase [Candidatus Merdenecus merdavium]|nr:guanylate kinase [Candidatus Merdenecus merdavium]
MGKIFYIMGKSSCGKDTIYKELMKNKKLNLKTIILYTTRPIRAGETDGVEYYFSNEEELKKIEESGRLIEMRSYETIHGTWKYFTVDDQQINLNQYNYLVIGTLVSYGKIKEYYGRDILFPIFIELDDGIRLKRAIDREMQQQEPMYKEVCRRFLADCEDFSEDKIKQAGIEKRYTNKDFKTCIEEIEHDMKSFL